MIRALRRLLPDRRGATIVEMGFVMLPLTLVLCVLFDFGYRMYAQSVVEGTLQRAARLATVGDKTGTQIDDFVKSQLTVFSKAAAPVITKTSYYQFTGVTKPAEYCDTNKNGTRDAGEPLKDAGVTGIGGSDDIVFYTVTLTFPRMFPLGRLLGWSNSETVTANTVMRNQPFGTQAIVACP